MVNSQKTSTYASVARRLIRGFRSSAGEIVARTGRQSHRGSRQRKRLRMQNLESRRMLVAEGVAFNFSDVVDTSALVGTVAASIDWGDGTQTTQTATGDPQNGDLTIRFDYSLDTSGFFSSPERRELLQSSADVFVKRFGDQLDAITPGGVNNWSTTILNPSTGAEHTINNPTIAANEIVVFAGARELGGSRLGEGGPGAWNATGTQAFLDNVRGRGQSGALASTPNDVAPWGGAITFDITTDWHFGETTDGLENHEDDFLTVAQHELAHLLGIGTAPSWNSYVVGGTFTGPAAVAEYDGSGNVPLNGNNDHFASAVQEGGVDALLTSTITTGSRKSPTALDFAALDDLGWEVLSTDTSVNTSHFFPDDGTYDVVLTLTGADRGEITRSSQVVVTNAAPQIDLSNLSNISAGIPFTRTDLVTVSDTGYAAPLRSPSSTETFTVDLNWGDGTPVETVTATIDTVGGASQPTVASIDAGHTYARPGTYTVTAIARDDDGGSAQMSTSVVVAASPELSLSVSQTSFAENDNTDSIILTVTRTGPITNEVVVTLIADDTSEVTLASPTVTIPAGQTEATVQLLPVDDAFLDGTQSVTLSANATGLLAGSADVSVTDQETITAEFNQSEINEGAGEGVLTLTIGRSNTDVDDPLQVDLSGGAAAELALASSVTIPAGQSQIVIDVTPLDDSDPELNEPETLVVSATGYTGTSLQITIIDNETPAFQNPVDRHDVDNNGTVLPLDALRVINEIARRGDVFSVDPANAGTITNYWDVSGDNFVSPLDALQVINELSRRQLEQGGGTGENAAADAVDRVLTDGSFDSGLLF